MRAQLIAAFILPAVVLADEPKVTAPISSEDVKQICALVRGVTAEPIGAIAEVFTQEYVEGVAPQQETHIPAKGETYEVTVYPRRDQVKVYTEPKGLLPMWFDIQKLNDKWTIIKKGRMRD